MFNILQGALHVLAQAAGSAQEPAASTAAPAASSLNDAANSAATAASSAADAAATAASSAIDAATSAAPAASSMTDAATTAATSAPPLLDTTVQQLADGGILHFVAQSDMIGKALFVILILMSLVSWYLIFVKSFTNWRVSRHSARFLNHFWASSSLEEVENEISTHGASEPFAHVASHAIHARNHHAKYGAMKLEEKGSTGAFVTRTIRKVIDEETAKLENGLTVLASIGSTAPFVGLFGTVWGVYHALIGIGLSDGVTINRIAGPVGEALIMTGLGLAVAIPAVLAYNAFVRSNRVYLARLDAFAHDLFTFLSTGQQVTENRGKIRGLPAAAAASRKGE
ncbi:MotA/TolQ/ExbB proton channel family protein [Pusillimonas sp.]|uniref:MotA/TolQ/ExbB proton channel family protein n=1 Tax=Pusillimonas sp. TaxID=3040095 RepID=UPI0029AFDE14|nr:MotA/TolQ/ExbB proton channel family protein [Pusillimonas sp.]MDX3893945.1 MotA/TolQ/ExbB proton channel family protein [Pusillimonas sp.]